MPRPIKLKKHQKIALGMAIVLFFGALSAIAAGAAASSRYAERFLPSTRVGELDISGLTRPEAAAALNRAFDSYVGNGFVVIADGKRITLDRASFGWNDPDQTGEIIRLDADATLDRAWSRGHSGPTMSRLLQTGLSFVAPLTLPLEVTINERAASSLLRSALSSMESSLSEPSFDWSESGAKLTVKIRPGKAGKTFDLERAVQLLVKDLRGLKNEPITLESRAAAPTVSDREAEELLVPEFIRLAADDLMFVYKDLRWPTSSGERAAWLTPVKKDGKPLLGVNREALAAYVKKNISEEVETSPVNAKFEVENDRVVAFEPSRDGLAVDLDSLAAALETEWIAGDKDTVSFAVKTAVPEITTEKSNNLGIKEILGIGTSTFAGSPVNRIKNIRNSVRKLNGILIKPGEIFSLLEALKPFTAEGGYLPEKVIKGNRIKPEIGGGACQIGTTTFRAAMNSGLPITARTNHSLVVSYYNDPKNGNPGTDATIYEPSPDFKFLNDTGNYIFFQALMDEKKGELRFIFWGTKDGRNGYYSKPVVSKWYPPGEPQEIKTTDLTPGTKDCQNAFKGADASFTYTVEKPDGTKEERVFTSHYRALPKICMVGATAEEVAAEKNSGETIPTADIPVPATNTNANINGNTNTNTP